MNHSTADIMEEWGVDMAPKQAPTHVGERFVRFMNLEEYSKFMAGWPLHNDREHCRYADTNSVGFCFVKVKDDETCRDAVLRAAEYLCGIVSDFVALAFENVSTHLNDGYGVYADPYGDWYDTIVCNEYSTREYDSDSMQLLETLFHPMQ